ncbi:MAG: SRPBCC domain-containing protein [Cyanobacteria bacterium P01_G01_bin.54]
MSRVQRIHNLSSLRQKLALMPGWSTEVVIDAPLHWVWEQATDFVGYSEWNPFVLDAEAEFEVGKKIRFLENLKQFGQHWITAKFLEINPPHGFVWQGHFVAPWLFTVRHSFQLEAINNAQTRFKQIHDNAGMFVPFLALRGIYCVSHQGYLDFDQALKVHCETSYQICQVDPK